MRDVVITFKAPPSILDQLNKVATKKKTSKSAIIRAALRKYFKEVERELEEQSYKSTKTTKHIFIKKIVIV